MSVDPGLFGAKEEFLSRVIEKLWSHPSDFQLAMERIRSLQKTTSPRKAAGVLVPLLFRPSSTARDTPEGTFVFQLIKRSPLVPQPGDLSCPGGMIHPVVDPLLRLLLALAPLPILSRTVCVQMRQRPAASRRIITLFLANALRESWEEIGLHPRHVRFLGPLPVYSLLLFRRTIFPLAAFVERPNPAPLRPNREVEKIVEIPLASFFQKELLGCYSLSAADPSHPGAPPALQFPCLIHREQDGTEEILWGATFHILVQFLRIVMDYRLPDWRTGRVIQRTLKPDYRTGGTHP
jgi:8-oxo-dGTP pyrophosphatase MutT (NUDIX family)